MLTLTQVKALRTWAGMSSGPSAVWWKRRSPSGQSRAKKRARGHDGPEIGIFLDEQGSGGVANVDCEKPRSIGCLTDDLFDLVGDFVKAAALRLNTDFVDLLAKHEAE